MSELSGEYLRARDAIGREGGSLKEIKHQHTILLPSLKLGTCWSLAN